MTDPGFDKFLKAFKARMYYSETKGGDHSTGNDKSSAMGKYQFLESAWLPQIKKFAKEKGWNDLATQQGTTVNKEFFIATPMLQEEFFDRYAEGVYSKVKNLDGINKRNLDIDEIAQLHHMYPAGVKTYLQGGKWNPPGKQTPVDQYLNKGKKGMEEAKVEAVRPVDTMTELERNEKASEYIVAVDQIAKKGYSKEVENSMVLEIQKKYKSQGLIPDVNKLIQQRTDDKKDNFNNEKLLFGEFYDVLAGAKSFSDPKKALSKDRVEVKASGGSEYMHIEIGDEKSKKIVQEIEKASGGKIKVRKYKDKMQLNFRMDANDPAMKYIADNIKKYSGADIIVDGSVDKENLIDDGLFNDTFKPLSFTKSYMMDEQDNRINATRVPDTEKVISTEAVPQPDKTVKKTEDKTEGEKTPAEAEAPVTPEANILGNLQELELPNTPDYDKKDFSQSVPYEAIASGLLALKGMKEAGTPIPKRNEQVSAMVTDYMAKVGRIAQMGLPVEMEAKARSDIAAGYQLGIRNLTNASGGNRNLILANQGQLDQAAMNANATLNIADAQAKNDALEQYGQGAMYIDSFNRDRDVANKRIEQALAADKRQAGGELAAAGFSSLIENINAHRENAPGTSRHMMMSMVRQNAFGFDPDMKDDGSGTKKGTRSWYQENVIKPIGKHNENVSYIKDNAGKLTPDKKGFVDKVATMSNDVGLISQATKFAMENELGKFDDESIKSALLENDFTPLSETNKYLPLPETNTEESSLGLYDNYRKNTT